MDLPEEEADADITAGASFTLHGNFKIFARAILTLNRIGNELYMEPSDLGLILRSLSCSKSAFGAFMFSKSFFSECDVLKLNLNAYNVCRIPMKCALSAFKCVKNSEKAVLSCQLYLNPRADSMLIQLTHTYDVVRSHTIPFFECTTMFRTVVDKANLNNCFVIQARLLLEMFNRMHHNTDEISIDAKIEEISFRNYITHEQDAEHHFIRYSISKIKDFFPCFLDKPDRDMVMKTEGKIPISEFQKYSIQRPVEITVNLRELKAIVNFADVYQSPISIYFDQPGTPIVIALEGDVNYTAEIILATAVDDSVGYDVSLEVPVEIVHASAGEGQVKRKRSQSSLNPHLSENLITDCAVVRKRIIETSSAKSSDTNELFNELENMDLVTGPPHATSSPISEIRCGKKEEYGPIGENLKIQGDVVDNGSNVKEISRTSADVDGFERSGSESPPSRGSALFRYLFSTDERTFDSAEFLRDAEVLASDSDLETSNPHLEQYIFDSDSEPNA